MTAKVNTSEPRLSDTDHHQGRQVATSRQNQPALYSEEMPEGLAPGQRTGISDRPEDNLIPMINVLQPLSPQLDSTNSKYLEGAKAGTIELKNSPGSGLVDGSAGFVFQMCDYRPVWIEWIDRERGGGFVARYADRDGKPDLPTAKPHPQDKYSFVNPASGNKIVNHHNHVGFVLVDGEPPIPAMISYKGAGISESRNWMTMIPRKRADGSDADACDFAWHVVAVAKSNAKGRWFDLRAKKRLGYVSKDQQELGRQLAEQFRTDQVQADYDSDNNVTGGGDSDAM